MSEKKKNKPAAAPAVKRSKYVSKGERRCVARGVSKMVRRTKTSEERMADKFAAWYAGKNPRVPIGSGTAVAPAKNVWGTPITNWSMDRGS